MGLAPHHVATWQDARRQSVVRLSAGKVHDESGAYYEARNDYTNNSETILLCNNVRVIGKLIPRQLVCVIGTFTESTL